MALVSVTEAARLAGKSRSYFYKGYIKTGKVSVTADHLGKPQIDTSEILRVFGKLEDTGEQYTAEQQATPPTVTSDSVRLAALETEVRMLREQLGKAESREVWLQGQVESLTDTVKRLDAPKVIKPAWMFWAK